MIAAAVVVRLAGPLYARFSVGEMVDELLIGFVCCVGRM